MPDKAQPESWSPDPTHLRMLERYGGRRSQQAIALMAAGQLLAPAVKWLWNRRNKTEDYTITVPGVDEIYPELHEWVLERIPEDQRKAMIASTEDLSTHGQYGYEEKMELRLRYDGSREQHVVIDGHKVVVKVERENVPERVNLPENWRSFMEKITFIAESSQGRDAIVKMIEGLIEEKSKAEQPPTLWIPSKWGGEWARRGDLPERSLESTILKDGQLESIVTDLGNFLAEEDEYNRLNQPWHRGYIFHGPPGTGKTSVARALANHFDLSTYYLPLGDIDKDTNLMQFVAAIQPRSMLLLEDIDVFDAATERTDKKDQVSIAAMLNALDGVWTPHGLITVMTTNNRDALDEALVRAGRIDVDEEFSLLDESQALQIIAFFNGCTDATCAGVDAADFVGESPADLIEAIKQTKGKDHEASSNRLHAVP